ncbi:MAG: adenylosuccinate lyase [Anaerolineae bacterium]|jgi:adenylosuccinate lyase|nr:adenylosuccinate lyase [Anaerolineae bacterium]
MTDFTHDTYISPFSWRYGSDAMREVWSLANQRRLWRRLWVALAEAQSEVGLVTAEQVADLRVHMTEVNIPRALEIEAEIHHDLMAEVKTYAEQCPVGGGVIHLGATSMDIEDNADALRLRDAVDLILTALEKVLTTLAGMIEAEADSVCMAFTHLQPAEPTTIGYRLANYAQDLLADLIDLRRVRGEIRGKGFKGAVGTAASYAELLHGTSMTPAHLETRVMSAFGLESFTITHQTYPRRQDLKIVEALSSIAMTCYRLAFDVRLLQSPPFGEWAEPFGSKQIGSSAMPFKRNPINAENIDSLARYIAGLPRLFWDNAAHHLLERTLDDSGNRRAALPDAFLATDEVLKRVNRVLSGLRIDRNGVAKNLSAYGTFAATERVLMEAARNGGDRQELHEVIRENSLKAWEALRNNQPNNLPETLSSDLRVTAYLTPDRVRELLDASGHIGDAPARARQLAAQVRSALG